MAARTQSNGQAMGLDRFGMDWAGRTALVVGLGKSGWAAARLLRSVGSTVRVTERSESPSASALAKSLETLGVESIELGRHSRAMVAGCDVVVVSPGVPESAPPIRWAQDAGVPIVSELELAFYFCPSPIVAVTGTNGKSSTVTLIHRILQAARRRSIACGNLGTPLSECVAALTPQTIAVVEVSSFQLVWCQQFRPMIGVLLNLGENHLDRHADRESYFSAKARLFQRQTPQDHALLNAADAAVVRIAKHIRSQKIWFGTPQPGPAPCAARRIHTERSGLAPHRARHSVAATMAATSPGPLRVPAEARRIHTERSAGTERVPAALSEATCRALAPSMQAVLQVARVLGVPDPLAYQVIREFRGLAHRLEHVATVRGVTFINDSKSTTPDSCLFALSRVRGAVVPILGGRDKGLDFQPLSPALREERVRGVVLIGEARSKLRALLTDSADVRECGDLDEAVQAAAHLARPGDTVLFSPACASFDMFTNFEERGECFRELVRHMAH